MDYATVAIEGVKLLLQGVFELVKVLNLPKEAVEKAFQEELAKFEANDPSNLPDV